LVNGRVVGERNAHITYERSWIGEFSESGKGVGRRGAFKRCRSPYLMSRGRKFENGSRKGGRKTAMVMWEPVRGAVQNTKIAIDVLDRPVAACGGRGITDLTLGTKGRSGLQGRQLVVKQGADGHGSTGGPVCGQTKRWGLHSSDSIIKKKGREK